MKHILFYTDTPNFGGAEKHMILLAKYLSKLGVSVALAYGRYSKMYKKHEIFKKWCPEIYVLETLHKHDPRHYFELRRLLREKKFDLIHIHLWNPGACRYAFFAASKSKIPIVTTEHDPFELTGWKRWIKKKCLKKTNQTIVVSSHNYGLIAEMYNIPEKKLNAVFNGIEIDKFLDNTQKADLPVQKGDYIITCIGELHPRKGHRYLLEAFRRLQTINPKMQLMIVGDGPIGHELRERYSNIPNVHFLGWRDDVRQILKASDILVLPSLKEAFGQVIIEAMASGVITIATNNGGTVDIIQHGKTGLLIPPANSEKIVDALKIAINNPSQKKDIEREALKWVKGTFTAEKMAEETLKVYSKIWEKLPTHSS